MALSVDLRLARSPVASDPTAGSLEGLERDVEQALHEVARLAASYATCGEVGFEGCSDYAAIGAVTNLAARLADEAGGGQILVERRLLAEFADDVDVERVGERILKGFSRLVAAFDVVAVREHEELDDADVAVSRADASAARPARP